MMLTKSHGSRPPRANERRTLIVLQSLFAQFYSEHFGAFLCYVIYGIASVCTLCMQDIALDFRIEITLVQKISFFHFGSILVKYEAA